MTTYGRELRLIQKMDGTAEIITKRPHRGVIQQRIVKELAFTVLSEVYVC